MGQWLRDLWMDLRGAFLTVPAREFRNPEYSWFKCALVEFRSRRAAVRPPEYKWWTLKAWLVMSPGLGYSPGVKLGPLTMFVYSSDGRGCFEVCWWNKSFLRVLV